MRAGSNVFRSHPWRAGRRLSRGDQNGANCASMRVLQHIPPDNGPRCGRPCTAAKCQKRLSQQPLGFLIAPQNLTHEAKIHSPLICAALMIGHHLAISSPW
jgi:hypothetical protein